MTIDTTKKLTSYHQHRHPYYYYDDDDHHNRDFTDQPDMRRRSDDDDDEEYSFSDHRFHHHQCLCKSVNKTTPTCDEQLMMKFTTKVLVDRNLNPGLCCHRWSSSSSQVTTCAAADTRHHHRHHDQQNQLISSSKQFKSSSSSKSPSSLYCFLTITSCLLLMLCKNVLIFNPVYAESSSSSSSTLNGCSRVEEDSRSVIGCRIKTLYNMAPLAFPAPTRSGAGGHYSSPKSVSLSITCHENTIPSSLSLSNINATTATSTTNNNNNNNKNNNVNSNSNNLNDVRELRIERCEITEIPANVFDVIVGLVNLTIRTNMNEWGDESTKIHVNSFNSLHRLERLDLSQNNINFLPANLFCDLSKKLSLLNLTANQFTDVSSIGFSGKQQQQQQKTTTSDTTYVSSSSQRSSPSSAAGSGCRMESLTKLDLTKNKLKVLTDRGFSLLPALQSLSLSHNVITRAEDTSLLGLSALKRLDLSNNQLIALPPRFLQPLIGSLEELLMQNNSLSVLPPGLFSGMKKLIELDLSHNEITSHWIGSDTFTDLINLRQLDLSFNRASRVDAATFKSLHQLQMLQLHHNEIESISEDAFASLHSLQTLVLSNNRLHKLDSLPFSGLHGLMSLSLDNNRLESLNEELFKNITSLFELNLSVNKLRSVPPAIERLSNLRSLDLSYNLITNISNTSYQGIDQLYGLNLESNRIGNLSKGVFSDLPSLRILNLAKNNIASIAQGTFDDVPDLHALRLDSNKISDINGLFVNLRDLLMLNISANRISWFDYALIPIGLHWLDVHSNQIESLGNYFEMESVLKLKSLDCSQNRIHEIDSSSFPDGIEIIYIYNNSLKKVAPFTFMGKQNLTRVDLTNNRLQTVDMNSFRLAKMRLHRQLPEFSVSNNPYMCDCNMEWLKNILALDESGQYPRFIDADQVNCQLTFKKHQQSLPLMQFNSTSFLCQYRSHCFALCHCCDFDACDCEMTCPDNCNCYYDSPWNNNIVDCSATSTFKHRSVPSRIPVDVTELYLDDNEIHTLTSHTLIGRRNLRTLHMNNSGIHTINNHTFNGLKGLQVLNLKHNHLTNLKGYEFEPLIELKELYLSFNKISVIANKTFMTMSKLTILHLDHNYINQFMIWTLERNNPSLNEIRLSHNSWSCECSFLKQLTPWLNRKSNIVPDASSMQCISSTSTSGESSSSSSSSLKQTIFASDVNSLCTNSVHPSSPYFGPSRSPKIDPSSSAFTVPEFLPAIIIVTSICLVIIIIVICVIVYRREIKVWFYSRFGWRFQGKSTASREEEKLFDCFVSYSKMDETFVDQILAPQLEVGNPPYRLCLHYRDLPVANSYLSSDAIVEAMEASRRSLLVISENFLKGEWCRYGFKSAHLEVLRSNQRHKLILVFIGKINSCDFDPDIRFWIKRSTILQWGEKMFWEKLRYAMPDVTSRKMYPDQTMRGMTVAVHT